MTHLPLGSSPHTCLSLHPVPWVTWVPSQVVGSLDPHLPPPSWCPAHFITQGKYSVNICYIGYYAYAVFHFYLTFLKSVLRVPAFFKNLLKRLQRRQLTFTERQRLCPLSLIQAILHGVPDHLEAWITEQTDFGAWLYIS